jgi:hypothetical protein
MYPATTTPTPFDALRRILEVDEYVTELGPGGRITVFDAAGTIVYAVGARRAS